MNSEEAVLHLRRQGAFRQLMHDAYLDEDLFQNGQRFLQSAEFAEARRLIGRANMGQVVDLGSGTGIAAYAFARSGARQVVAIEPDLSPVVGAGAIHSLTAGLPVMIIAAYGEAIPLPERSVNVVYGRQVLHHTADPHCALRECARILAPGGVLLACREHVVDDQAQLSHFLRHHPVHQLTAGENAYSLAVYVAAIKAAGLRLKRLFGPWDSVINAFPAVKSAGDLESYPATLLRQKMGAVGGWLATLPFVRRLVWQRLKRPLPGRLYSFWAVRDE
jgi:SAM-dependent methyltransferase